MRVAVLVRYPNAVVLDEIASTLADAFGRVGVAAELVLPDDELRAAPDLAVLVGQGPEFRSVDWLWKSAGFERPTTVVSWLTDPLPPPALDEGLLSTRLEHEERRVRVPDGRVGAFARRAVPTSVRKRVVQWQRKRNGVDGAVIPGMDRASSHAMFDRLGWVLRSVRDRRIDHVLVPAHSEVDLLAEHGVTATFVPFGYHPSLGKDEGRTRDIDVLFLGASQKLRDPALAEIDRGLRRSGRSLTIPPYTWGDDRARLLNRTRIMVTMSSCPWFPVLHRHVLAAAGGAMVLARPDERTSPFEAGVHHVVAPVPEMAATAEHYLRHESERRAIVDNAWTLVSTDVTMDRAAEKMLALADHAPGA